MKTVFELGRCNPSPSPHSPSPFSLPLPSLSLAGDWLPQPTHLHTPSFLAHQTVLPVFPRLGRAGAQELVPATISAHSTSPDWLSSRGALAAKEARPAFKTKATNWGTTKQLMTHF